MWASVIAVLQLLSHVRLFATPMDCSTPGFPVLHSLPELVQTHVHWVNDAIQPSHPLSSPSLPAFYLSQQQGLFQWVALHIRWPNYWSFSFSNSPSNEYLGLISFRIDCFDFLAVQGTLKSLCQYHSSKASVLQLQLWWQTKFYARTHQKSKNFTQFLEPYDTWL